MAYTNSSLVSYTKLSPNHSGQRTHSIDRITPHCVVGQCSVETLGNIFLPTSRQASSNYGIGVDRSQRPESYHHRVCQRQHRALRFQRCGVQETRRALHRHLQAQWQDEAALAGG